MTARGVASRLVAVHGVLGAKQRVLSRMERHHALTIEARGRDTDAFLHAAARFTVWAAVSTAILRREGVGHA